MGHAAVVSAHEVLAGQLVQAGSQALAEPTAVHEHDHRAMGADLGEHRTHRLRIGLTRREQHHRGEEEVAGGPCGQV